MARRTDEQIRISAALGHRVWYKRFLPRTLFGRAFLIIVAPVVLMQATAAWVFYDRHWDDVTSELVFSIVAEIGMVIDRLEDDPDQADRSAALISASRRGNLLIKFCPECRLDEAPPPLLWDPFLIRKLNRTMRERLLGYNYRIRPEIDNDNIEIILELKDGEVLSILAPLQRIYTSTTHIFLLWLFGSAIALFTISVLFMRNQIRPIRRLALASDLFGKGRDVPDFKPEGATEVRQAAAAFLIMRERIQRQIEQRTELLAGVSHDLRTPLTRMKLQLSMLPQSKDISELQDDLEEMEAMIHAYLDFARGEGSEAVADVLLEEFLGDIVHAAQRQGTNIHTDIAPKLRLSIRPNEMRRCVNNLISNARRYGGGEIWLTARSFLGRIEIVVEDNGVGITGTELEAVFKPFVRLEDSRNPATGGVGLGLTIARDIARSHGGEITLSHSTHGGLKAMISLPM